MAERGQRRDKVCGDSGALNVSQMGQLWTLRLDAVSEDQNSDFIPVIGKDLGFLKYKKFTVSIHLSHGN